MKILKILLVGLCAWWVASIIMHIMNVGLEGLQIMAQTALLIIALYLLWRIS